MEWWEYARMYFHLSEISSSVAIMNIIRLIHTFFSNSTPFQDFVSHQLLIPNNVSRGATFTNQLTYKNYNLP